MSADESTKMEDWAKGIPLAAGDWGFGIWQPSPEAAEYWEGVARNELLLKFCPHCKRHLHPKRIVCPDCQTIELTWKASKGRGKVYSFSEIHRAPSDVFQTSSPYTVGMVRLDEGVTLFTRFFGPPGSVKIDAPATVDYRVLEMGQKMPVFMVGS